MKRFLLAFSTLLFALGAAASSICASCPSAGDRRPEVDCVYPSSAFMHAGQGRTLIDVTQPPFDAKGDGRTDDTAAFVRAYDFVLAKLDEYLDGGGSINNSNERPSYSIYVPNGTYVVSDTIVYTGPTRGGKLVGSNGQRRGQPWEKVVGIRFIGQERDRTVIRLKDHCPGFQAGAAKPVVSYGKYYFNNNVALNVFRNITINTGEGNHRAVGLDFVGANNADITNVTIRSEDGSGAIGLHIRMPPTQGYHRDITVEGFDYGIYLTAFHATYPVFEYVTLRGQRKSGIGVGDSAGSFRCVDSDNEVPALTVEGPGGHAVLLDSVFDGKARNSSAIDLSQGQLFARNVHVSGYRPAVRTAESSALATEVIDHYVSDRPISATSGSPPRSLGLRVEELPLRAWPNDLKRWANVDDFGATADGTTDDSGAVQAAMDSNKPVVFLPRRGYRIESPIRVPATVERVQCLFQPTRMTLLVDEPSSIPLIVQDGIQITFRVACDRPVVLDRLRWTGVQIAPGNSPRPVFINGCSPCNLKNITNARIWCRFINNEGRALPIIAGTDCDMWILGYKTERGHSFGRADFEAIDGGRLEVLGGVTGVGSQGGILNVKNAQASLIACTTSAHSTLAKTIAAVQTEQKKNSFRSDTFPARPCRGTPVGVKGRGKENIFVPLFVAQEK